MTEATQCVFLQRWFDDVLFCRARSLVTWYFVAVLHWYRAALALPVSTMLFFGVLFCLVLSCYAVTPELKKKSFHRIKAFLRWGTDAEPLAFEAMDSRWAEAECSRATGDGPSCVTERAPLARGNNWKVSIAFKRQRLAYAHYLKNVLQDNSVYEFGVISLRFRASSFTKRTVVTPWKTT